MGRCLRGALIELMTAAIVLIQSYSLIGGNTRALIHGGKKKNNLKEIAKSSRRKRTEKSPVGETKSNQPGGVSSCGIRKLDKRYGVFFHDITKKIKANAIKPHKEILHGAVRSKKISLSTWNVTTW